MNAAYLFPVVEALVVVLEDGVALLLAGLVVGAGVDDVTCEHFLPEGEATAGTCRRGSGLVHVAFKLAMQRC